MKNTDIKNSTATINRTPKGISSIYWLGFIIIALGMWNVAHADDLNIFAKLSKQVVPSVVNLSVVNTVQTDYSSNQLPPQLGGNFFQYFFGNNLNGKMPPSLKPGPGYPGRAQKEVSLGTGFIIDASGILLTNNHVVAHGDKVEIQFTESSDEKPIEGKVIGRDPDLDVALISFKPTHKLTAVVFGDSDALEVGEFVMAVGNPYGQGHSVTHGIVSAKGRVSPDVPMANYLQTDAPINPGNSGGPLLNLRGEVVGINNAIDARAQGISFAIPINFVKAILPQLKANGKVSRGFIGAAIGQLTPEVAEKVGAAKDLRAPFVANVSPGGPAEKAGIQPYDVILSVGKNEVHSPSELVQAVTAIKVGETVAFTISRSGKTKKMDVEIGKRPTTDKLSQNERPAEETAPDVGMSTSDRPGKSGVEISGLDDGSPAAEAGLRLGDVILELDRKPVKNSKQLYASLKDSKSHLLRIERKDQSGGNEYAVVILDLSKDGKS